MDSKRKQMFVRAETSIAEKQSQVQGFAQIDTLIDDQVEIYDDEVAAFQQFKDEQSAQKQAWESCELANIEAEATLEAIVEEETNLMRLNSLLRFLVIGDQPNCDWMANCETGSAPGGSCTWRNRGVTPAAGDEGNCETE